MTKAPDGLRPHDAPPGSDGRHLRRALGIITIITTIIVIIDTINIIIIMITTTTTTTTIIIRLIIHMMIRMIIIIIRYVTGDIYAARSAAARFVEFQECGESTYQGEPLV